MSREWIVSNPMIFMAIFFDGNWGVLQGATLCHRLFIEFEGRTVRIAEKGKSLLG